MTGIFESHAHYEDEAFDEDRDELINRSFLYVVSYITCMLHYLVRIC